ncbi:MAG: 3-hydroxyacyl-ACP dehydratase FabZ [Sphingomonadales bacterium]
MNSETQAVLEATTLDVMRIMELIPHRYPMLLIDRVQEIELGVRAVGIKNVTINEGFFAGHFPQRPVMPGVLIVEALAQTAAVLASLSLGEDGKDKLVYFMSISGAKFRRPVEPGHQLELEVKVEKKKGKVWRFSGTARADGNVMAEATFTAMLADA